MHEIVRLSITSFRGSIGGEHYYGKLHVETKMTRTVGADGSTGLSMRMGYGVDPHPHDGHEVQRTLGAREAAYLNKKDDSGWSGSMGLKAGDMTTRFNDVDSVITAAVETFPTMFDETDVLTYSKSRYDDDDLQVLAGPEAVRDALGDEGMKALTGVTRREKRERWLMAHGYMLLA